MRLTSPGGIMDVAERFEKIGKEEESFYVGRGEHGIG